MSRLRRWLFRLPVLVYRARLGPLLGRHFLLLEHRRRRSGIRHRTVLEVVDHADGSPIVVSGFGATSDWLRNVRADPAVSVTWRRRRFPARAVLLATSDAATVFDRYRSDHPRLAPFLERRLGLSIVDDPRKAAEEMPVVRLDPVSPRVAESSGA